MNGDDERLYKDFYNLQAFVNKYLNFHLNQASGLIYWETNEVIGMNDPTTFILFQQTLIKVVAFGPYSFNSSNKSTKISKII